MEFRMISGALVVVLSAFAGCSSSSTANFRSKTFPVTGTVHVDGQPAAMLTVRFHPESAAALTDVVTTTTNEQGKFTVTTYKKGDRLPAGNYVLTFKWQSMGLKKDRLNGAYEAAYMDPKKSTVEVTIVADKPNDLGVIELSTKAKGK